MEKLHPDLKIHSSKQGTDKRVSFDSISKFLKTMNMSHDHFRKYLKTFGWTGRLMQKNISIYVEPHYTNLTLKNGSFPRTIFTEELQKYEKYDGCEEILSYPFPTFKPIESESIDDFETILPFVYDVEVTREHSFVGIRLYGYEPVICSISDFRRVIRYIEEIMPTKTLVLIGYNDVYDSNIILLGEQIKTPTKWEFVNLNFQLIESMSKLDKIPPFLKESKDKLRKFIEQMKNCDAIRIHSKYCSIAEDINGNFLTFDIFSEMFQSSGSLKHHAHAHGLKWSARLEDDVFTYNKEDLENTLQLFLKLGGIDIVKALMNLKVSAKSTSRALSKNLLVSEFTRNTFTDNGNFIDKAKCKRAYLLDFKKKAESTYNFKETTSKTILYGGNVLLKGGDGGVHSMLSGLYIDHPLILDIDYTSFYPSILSSDECPLLTDTNREILKKLTEQRIEFKKTNKPVSDALKVAINSIYGQLAKFKTEKDMQLTEYVTTLAKAHILELLRIVERNAERVIDVNTDGVIAKFNPNFDVRILEEELKSLKFQTEISKFDYLAYKCVGSYLGRLENKTYKIKGSWLSDSKYFKFEGNTCYNILNIPDILINFLEKKEFIPPKILKRITIDGESKMFKIVDTFDFGVDKSSLLTGCSPTSSNKGLDRLTPIEISEWVVNSKLQLINYNI